MGSLWAELTQARAPARDAPFLLALAALVALTSAVAPRVGPIAWVLTHDKAAHVLTFALLGALALRAGANLPRRLLLLDLFAGAALLIEALQNLFPAFERDGNWQDAAASLSGLALGFLAMGAFRAARQGLRRA